MGGADQLNYIPSEENTREMPFPSAAIFGIPMELANLFVRCISILGNYKEPQLLPLPWGLLEALL